MKSSLFRHFFGGLISSYFNDNCTYQNVHVYKLGFNTNVVQQEKKLYGLEVKLQINTYSVYYDSEIVK